MDNFKLVIEYDGTDFAGWQVQPGKRTVQGELERSLSQLTQERVTVNAAGRTDAGVHARGQVGNFHLAHDRVPEMIYRGGNALLPLDIRILAAERIHSTFHARFDAQNRIYRYVISPMVTAIDRRYAWHVRERLDLEAMKACCGVIVGERDFRSFTPSRSDLKHGLCRVNWALWRVRHGWLSFEISANRFLHHMVRILVGTMVEIGRGKRAVGELTAILNAGDRRAAGPTAPAHGLFLLRVEYNSADSI